MLNKNFAVTLNFFLTFQCLSMLSPIITTDLLLFELMSQLLIDELPSIFSAVSFADALSALCNSVDCLGSMCSVFWFLFCTLFVLPFLVSLEDSANFESAITSV